MVSKYRALCTWSVTFHYETFRHIKCPYTNCHRSKISVPFFELAVACQSNWITSAKSETKRECFRYMWAWRSGEFSFSNIQCLELNDNYQLFRMMYCQGSMNPQHYENWIPLTWYWIDHRIQPYLWYNNLYWNHELIL